MQILQRTKGENSLGMQTLNRNEDRGL
ncbi:hypothetical protein Goari_014178 [Gossypium aridum]|uniref:Uncharacterized protein n=1 Tax=Gossypium aridum TaxID=34290 RepID=A0A7J8XH06_GOSAI|nr:hypothetical protein [Gossypium aridum]